MKRKAKRSASWCEKRGEEKREKKTFARTSKSQVKKCKGRVRKYQIFIGRREEQGEECKEGSASEGGKEGRSRLEIQEC